MASLSSARTSRRGAIGLEAIRDVRGPGADTLIRAYSDTNIEVTGKDGGPVKVETDVDRVGAGALCVCRAKFWLPRCTPKTLYTLVSTAKVRRLTTKRIQIVSKNSETPATSSAASAIMLNQRKLERWPKHPFDYGDDTAPRPWNYRAEPFFGMGSFGVSGLEACIMVRTTLRQSESFAGSLCIDVIVRSEER